MNALQFIGVGNTLDNVQHIISSNVIVFKYKMQTEMYLVMFLRSENVTQYFKNCL